MSHNVLYFQWLKFEHAQLSCTVFLRFCAGRTPVGRLAGAVLAPTGRIACNQGLPGKDNPKVYLRASLGPVRPGTTDHTDILKPVYGFRTGPHSVRIHNCTDVPEPVLNPQGPVWPAWCPHMNLMEPFRVFAYGIVRFYGQRTCKKPIEHPLASNQYIACG